MPPRIVGGWRLQEATLYVTLEPCAMCAGAIVLARIKRLVYGADDPKAGAAGTIFNIVDHPALNHRPEVRAGMMATEAADSCGSSSPADGSGTSWTARGAEKVDAMSLKDKGYAVYWALAGLARPFTTAAFLRERAGGGAERAAGETAHPRNWPTSARRRRLSILPLVEYYPADERLAGEPGVSYLVTVDGTKILFDVGWNVREEHPSPLLRNMETLGVSAADLDAVFISHSTSITWVASRRCGGAPSRFSARPVDLAGIPAYVPAAMTHPSAQGRGGRRAAQAGRGSRQQRSADAGHLADGPGAPNRPCWSTWRAKGL